MTVLLSVIVYLQMFVCGVVYCAFALPLLLIYAICAGFNGERTAPMVRILILYFGKTMIFVAVRPYVRIRVEDVSGEGPERGAVFVLNHRSASDPFLVATIPTAVASVQAVNGWPMRLPFFGFFARRGHYLDVTKEPYEETKEKTLKLLRKGVSVFVFPEGTRSGGKHMNQFHGTFFRIAKEAGAPIVPVAIAGNEKIPDRKFRMSPGRILVRRLPRISAETVRDTPLFKLKEMVRNQLMEETRKMDEELSHHE